MSILKDKAEALRLLAAKLEQFGNDVPRKAKEVIRQFGGPDTLFKYTQLVALELASDPEFVKHTIKRAGVELGAEIGKKLRATASGFIPPTYGPYCYGTAKYEAQVYVFTPAELESLVTAALEAGRLQSKFLSTADIFGVAGSRPLTATEILEAQKRGYNTGTPTVSPLAFGQRIFYNGERTCPREIIYVNRLHDSVSLVGPTGKQENSFASLDDLAKQVGPGRQYERTPR